LSSTPVKSHFIILRARRPPSSTLFPYTTLFRSIDHTSQQLRPSTLSRISHQPGSRNLPHNRVVHLAENGCRILQCLGNKVDAIEDLIQRVASKVLRLPGSALSALPRLGRATLDAVPDAAASETALHQRRETNPATPSSISSQERGPVSASPQTLRHEHAITATHRHELVITITHPRHARQNAATRKSRRQRHRRQRRNTKLLRNLVEVTNQRTVDNSVDNKP